jgi:hypothetical protein
MECSPYGHQLIIMTTLNSVVRGNVGAILVELSEIPLWRGGRP